MSVTLSGKCQIVPTGVVLALGKDPNTRAVIEKAMADIVNAAREVLLSTGDPEARAVAGGVKLGGAKGKVLPFQAHIVPGPIPVGLVVSNHPASVRWEFGSTASPKQIFGNKKGTGGGGGGARKAKVRLPTPATGFMRTALVRAAAKSGRRSV